MERTTMYRIVLTCWDKDEPEPYADFVDALYLTRENALSAMRACVKDELETLNEREYEDVDIIEYPADTDDFRADFDGDNDAIIRFWDGDDYRPVTAYNIYEVVEYGDNSWSYRTLSMECRNTKGERYVHKMYYSIGVNAKRTRFSVMLNGEDPVTTEKSFDAALSFIDDEILKYELASARSVYKKDEKEWVLPVTWEVCGFVKVKGKTLEEAIENFERDADHIPLPSDASYVDGSFQLTSTDINFIECYNPGPGGKTSPSKSARYALRVYISSYCFERYDDGIYTVEESKVNRKDILAERTADTLEGIVAVWHELLDEYVGYTYCVKDVFEDTVLIGGVYDPDDVEVLEEMMEAEEDEDDE